MILPSDLLFVLNTTTLDRKVYPLLNDVAQLLRSLEKINIKITGYTDNTKETAHNLALSRQQAEVIARYLWRQGIDTRLLVANGYGEQMPIASNNTAAGQAANRRIEIALCLVVEPDDM